MTSTKIERPMVVVQLSGGNDPLNTIVPYNNGLYYDQRHRVRIAQDEVLPINDELGFHPSMGPIKKLWDEGKVAIINGIGYPNPNRSHFRAMDIWHTAEPDKVGSDGVARADHKGPGPAGRKCAHGRQLRPRSSQSSVLQRGSSSVGRRPGNLRTVPQRERRRKTTAPSRRFHHDVRWCGGWGPRSPTPKPDRNRCYERRRHT